MEMELDHKEYELSFDGRSDAPSPMPLTGSPNGHSQPFLSIGNITILNWGTIIHDNNNFHSSTQLYPLGFKCIRQEHDVFYDRIVDCLCEIDAAVDGKSVYPIFRISIAWSTDFGQPCIRVYEAKSPQLAWQAAMLESIGLEYSVNIFSDDAPDDSGEAADQGMDEEEMQLRNEIRETRRDYFRALRNEQSLGLQGAVKPRLSIDSVDGFGDDVILRMMEGLPNAELCEGYQFLDTRSRDHGRTNVARCFARMHTVNKQIEKVMRKNSVKEVVKEVQETHKRERDEQFEKNKKVKVEMSKELKLQKLHQLAAQKQKLRDLEKTLKGLRETILKDIRRRRSDVKVRMEGICDAEEGRDKVIAVSSLKPEEFNDISKRGPRPASSRRPVPFTGDCYGEFLELWGFIITFSEPLGLAMVPSISQLEDAFRFANPFMRDLCRKAFHYFHALDNVTGKNKIYMDLYRESALMMKHGSEILDNLGVALCRPLMAEFFKLMGMDSELLLDVDRILNTHSWREVARVILFGAMSKELGVAEADIIAANKGRGFTSIPDATDRRVLRLTRKRILSNYRYRRENQEAISDFNNGLCVRIPYAYCDSFDSDFSWNELLDTLQRTPDSCEWKIYELVVVSILACAAIEDDDMSSWTARLREAISPAVFHARSASDSKMVAVEVLSELAARFDLAAEREEAQEEKEEAIESLSQVRRRFAGANRPIYFATSRYNVQEATSLLSKLESLHTVDEGEEEEEERREIMESLGKMALANDLTPEEEVLLIEKLSVAGQRCFYVIRDLMVHPQAAVFNYPVDVTTSPDYYKRISHPLSFSDIRYFLVRGMYEGSYCLTKFYLDTCLVLENALTYNSEISPMGQAAAKAIVVFERLFLEIVLSLESVLFRNENCHFCRADDDPLASTMVVCDRCDGHYHIKCLESTPNNILDKRAEWFCPGCIEQYSVSSTHFLKSASVKHPITKCEGDVVGIDQVNFSIRFTVVFKDNTREVWRAGKVMRNVLRMDTTSEVEGGALELPAGFSVEDINMVSCLARGYTGWGSLQLPFSPFIDIDHSLHAASLGQKHYHLSRWQRVISALGWGSDPSQLSSEELLEVFVTLMRRNLASHTSSLASSIASLDTSFTYITFDPSCTALKDIAVKPSVAIGNDLKFVEMEAADTPAAELASTALDNSRAAEGPSEIENKENSDAESIATVSLKSLNEDSSIDDLFSVDSCPHSDKEDLFEDDFDPDRDPVMHAESKRRLAEAATWDLRRSSRIKGREDALLTLSLMNDVVSSVNISFTTNSHDGGCEEMEEEGHIYQTAVVQAGLKACLPRVADVVDVNEWQQAWERKLSAGCAGVTCQYCGFTEIQIGSSLVCAETWKEWLATESALQHKADAANGDVVESIWLPYDKVEAAVEQAELTHIPNKMLRSGSMVAHEWCADIMSVSRRIALKRSCNKEDDSIVEKLNGIRRGQRNPLGVDLNGNLYWVFAGCSSLFISTPETASMFGYCPDSAVLDQLHRADNPASDGRMMSHQKDSSSRWHVYSSNVEIAHVIRWLNAGSALELNLKKLLKILFPDATLMISTLLTDPTQPVLCLSGASPPSGPSKDSMKNNVIENDIDSTSSLDADESSVVMEGDDEEATWEEDEDDEFARPKRALKVASSVAVPEESEQESKPVFQVSSSVLVKMSRAGLLVDAKIYQVEHVNDIFYYNLRFVGSPRVEALVNWYPESSLHRKTPSALDLQQLKFENYVKENVVFAPLELNMLYAIRFLRLSDRAGAGVGRCRGHMSFSDAASCPLSTLKTALLAIEAALPIGSLDESDERWGSHFDEPWRNAVAASSNATSLMECLIILEYGIKSSWVKPSGSKVLTCLPSRTFSVKYATYGLVALRLLTFDHALRYEKVVITSTGDRSSSAKAAPKPSKGRKGR